MKKYTPTVCLNGYTNIAIFISDFLLAKNRRQEWLSRVRTRNRKVVREWRNIESDFYGNSSLNDDLESEIYKDFWRCSYITL